MLQVTIARVGINIMYRILLQYNLKLGVFLLFIYCFWKMNWRMDCYHPRRHKVLATIFLGPTISQMLVENWSIISKCLNWGWEAISEWFWNAKMKGLWSVKIIKMRLPACEESILLLQNTQKSMIVTSVPSLRRRKLFGKICQRF